MIGAPSTFDQGNMTAVRSLPRNLALVTLEVHAHGLGLAVHDDPDNPALMRWLRGER
jgi:hypothetical protein